ncbi:MAG: hypothetical protein HY023_08535 [Chloroflexi bacterium]|nr:hypothetical protein [Chloroflexota bacterium]
MLLEAFGAGRQSQPQCVGVSGRVTDVVIGEDRGEGPDVCEGEAGAVRVGAFVGVEAGARAMAVAEAARSRKPLAVTPSKMVISNVP